MSKSIKSTIDHIRLSNPISYTIEKKARRGDINSKTLEARTGWEIVLAVKPSWKLDARDANRESKNTIKRLSTYLNEHMTEILQAAGIENTKIERLVALNL